jgi:FSR family fosmidomycin resistance protein-like MFS transporter
VSQSPVEAAGPAGGEFDARRVSTLAVAHWVHDSYSAFLAPLLIIFKANFGLSNAEAGLLSVFYQEASLAQPFIGGIADRFGPRYFIVFAPAITGVAMSLLGLAPSYLAVGILLTIAGLSSACLHAVGPVVTGHASGRKLGQGMSIWMVGGEAGRFVGPLVIGAWVPLMGMQRMPWLMIAGLVTSAVLLVLLRQPDSGAMKARTKLSLRHELAGKGRFMAIIVGFTVVHVFMSAALVTYLPVLLHESGDSFWLASVSLAVLQAAGVLGALAGGTLSDRLGRRTMLFFSVLPTSIFMFVFLGVGGWLRFPVLVILGVTSLSITPVVMALVQETFPNNRALANGLYMAVNFIVRALVVLLVGWFGDLFGLRTAFAVSAVVPLLGLPLLYLLPAKARVS